MSKELTSSEKARLRFALETAPAGISVDRLLSAIRGAGGSASINTLKVELAAMAKRGECREFPHPARENEFMYGCNVGEVKD